MPDGFREGIGSASSTMEISICGGTTASRGMRWPHCDMLADTTREGGGGANGWREQVGPVHEQGLFGIRVSERGEINLLEIESVSADVCWTWVG